MLAKERFYSNKIAKICTNFPAHASETLTFLTATSPPGKPIDAPSAIR
jgi:hypothetical protein